MKRQTEFTAELRKRMAMRGIGSVELANALGITQQTTNRRIAEPDKLTVRDLRIIARTLRTDVRELTNYL